jgi:acetyltransferase-like isoleucine patch superfamily enzyme
MSAWNARWLDAWDRWRSARLRTRFADRLDIGTGASPHLHLAELRIEPGARVRIGAGLYTERRRRNRIWAQRESSLTLGERAWLRTEHGENHITLFPGARIDVGPDALLNGAMLHAKRAITIGSDVRLAFGARVLDADLHDIDAQTPERVAEVRIGDRVWIGANAIVLRGVAIGDDVIVGAGSVVVRDLPSRCIAVGAPARPVREIGSRVGCR